MQNQEVEVKSKQSKAEQTVIYLHIPKTGGTTLKRIADRHYPRESVYTIERDGTIDEFKKLSNSRKSKIRLLRGHQGYGLHKYLPGPSTYFAILRDPIERVVSYYYYIRRSPQHYCYDLITSNGMSLKDFLESEADAIADNGQTRLLSGMMESGWEVEFGECTEEVREAAKENLRKNFAVVGLTEEFDKTLFLLKRTFGWQRLFYARQNVSPKRPKRGNLSQVTLDAVTKVNLFDLELYQYATRIFQEQVRQQDASFAKEVESFQSVNQRLSPLIRMLWEMRRISVRQLVGKCIQRALS